jgi:transcriptional regulator with XRE-family HTH domain
VDRDAQHVLGRAIRKRRRDLGLSQEKLAERADLHWTYIGGIERGERNVSLVNIVKIAKALKSRVSELLADLD